MGIYVFSEEIYNSEYGKPKGKGAWTFGDRNRTFTITVGEVAAPLSYEQAKKAVTAALEQRRYPMYKTIYLLP